MNILFPTPLNLLWLLCSSSGPRCKSQCEIPCTVWIRARAKSQSGQPRPPSQVILTYDGHVTLGGFVPYYFRELLNLWNFPSSFLLHLIQARFSSTNK